MVNFRHSQCLLIRNWRWIIHTCLVKKNDGIWTWPVKMTGQIVPKHRRTVLMIPVCPTLVLSLLHPGFNATLIGYKISLAYYFYITLIPKFYDFLFYLLCYLSEFWAILKFTKSWNFFSESHNIFSLLISFYPGKMVEQGSSAIMIMSGFTLSWEYHKSK